MSAQAYATVRGSVAVETEVRRSRFLCVVERVGGGAAEEAARAVVERQRRAHHDARHHCSAFVLGPPPQPVQRSSDDGEPAGTAGAPMLEVLRGAGLSDVVAVVTRWFGGTLLGAGGLVRAYGDAVRAALDEADVVHRSLLVELEVDVPHADAGRIEGELRTRGTRVLGATYAGAVTLRLGVAPEREPALHATLAELSSGALAAREVGRRWVDA